MAATLLKLCAIRSLGLDRKIYEIIVHGCAIGLRLLSLLPKAFRQLSFPPYHPIMLLANSALLLGLTAYVSAITIEDNTRALPAQRSAAGTDDWPIGTQTGDG